MKYQITALLVLIVFLVGCSDVETPTGQAIKEPVKETETKKAPSEQTKEEKPVQKETEIVQSQETKETPEEKIYSMNEDIKVDYLIYKVTKAETFTKMGSSILKKETTGKFVKVYLKLTNNAKETKQIFTPRFKLVDGQDRQFDRLSDDMMYIADYLEFGKQLQPSLTVSGAIVFELPKESKDLKLEIRGDWLSVTKVVIDLSNIRNIGTDTTLKDKQDEMIDEIMEEAQQDAEEMMDEAMADAQRQMDELMEQFG